MYCFLLSLMALVLNPGKKVLSAPSSIYEEVPNENIDVNLIGYETDLIEGLAPPLPEALDHYNLRSQRSELENLYIVEISTNYLKIKTSGLPDQKIKLTQEEKEGIQKLSLSIVELLNSSKLVPQRSEDPGHDIETPEWSRLNPAIILTNSGISLQFFNTSETDPQVSETSAEHKRILWDFLAKYAKNIFVEKLHDLKISDKLAEVVDSPPASSDSSPFENFVDLVWRIMTFSVNYAEKTFQEWTATSYPETEIAEVYKKPPPTAATFLAFEEPSPFHEFPSQEFQFRRKDVDSIFYGRGVI